MPMIPNNRSAKLKLMLEWLLLAIIVTPLILFFLREITAFSHPVVPVIHSPETDQRDAGR